MQFIAMKMLYRISNPLINEQKAAALADVRVRQHDFCEWISGLDAPWSISNRTAGNFLLTEPLPAKAGRFGLLLKQPKVVATLLISLFT